MNGRAPLGCPAAVCRRKPSVSPLAAPAAVCKCQQAAVPGAWANALFQVGRQIIDSHPVDAPAPLLRFTCASALFRFARSTTASIDGPNATARPSTSTLAACASVARAAVFAASPLAPAPKFSSIRLFCRMARARLPLYWPAHRSGLRRTFPPTMPSADFCAAISRLATTSVPFAGTQAQTSRGKTDRLHRTPAGSTTPDFDGRGLRDHLLARPGQEPDNEGYPGARASPRGGV